MKLGLIDRLFPLMFSKVVYGYTEKAVPALDIRAFKKQHKKNTKQWSGARLLSVP